MDRLHHPVAIRLNGGWRNSLTLQQVGHKTVGSLRISVDHVQLPGIYVDRIVHNPTPEKRVEQRTVRAGAV